jgi:hypothetical protein
MSTRWLVSSVKAVSLAFVFLCAVCLMPVTSGTAAVAQSNGVVHSATGSGRIAMFYGQPYRDSYSFNAELRADGRISGQVQYTDREMGYTVHGEVIDLKVEGNMAKIAYRFARPPKGLPQGWLQDQVYGFFVVVDGGEGNNAPAPDMISWWFSANEDGCVCGGLTTTPLNTLIGFTPTQFLAWETALGFVPELFVYMRGNIQVR